MKVTEVPDKEAGVKFVSPAQLKVAGWRMSSSLSGTHFKDHQWSRTSRYWHGSLSGWKWSGLQCLTFPRVAALSRCNVFVDGKPEVKWANLLWMQWRRVMAPSHRSSANWTVEPLWRWDSAHQQQLQSFEVFSSSFLRCIRQNQLLLSPSATRPKSL